MNVTFAYPWLLLLLPLVPVLWWWSSRRHRRSIVRFSALAPLRQAGGGAAARGLLPALGALAFAALIVAAARPQEMDVTRQLYAEGIAIQMVLDISGSMETDDMLVLGGQRRATRLEVVKTVFRRFVMGDGDELPGRPNDIIGLIEFARYADSVCPLTLDREQLVRFLDEAETIQARAQRILDEGGRTRRTLARIEALKEEDGTAIGDALALAVERLKDLRRTAGSGDQHVITSRVIVLLTDGEDNVSIIEPEQAGDLAATYGIRVYTIMAGVGQDMGLFVRPVDDSALKHIAEVTGGRHFTARTPGALLAVYEEIDRLERSQTEERRFVRAEERAWPWLLAAFAATALQYLLANTWLRKLP